MDGDRATPLVTGRRAAADRRTLGWCAAGLAGAGLVIALLVAPADAAQGDAQRLMYLHVPAAWTAYLAFLVVLAGSVGYLRWRDPRWDRAARAAAEIGVACTAVTIAAGMLWGRAVWGVWWTWDPRLISTTLMLLVYVAYLAARGSGADARRTPHAAAWLGVAGYVSVPVVHFSVVWWRSLHQPATLLAPHRPPMAAVMLVALLLCVAATTAAATWLFLHRLRALEATALRGADGPFVLAVREGARRA
jgi:heme exporter protein C